MVREAIRALVVGIEDEHYRELTQEEGFTVEAADALDEETDGDVDAVVVALKGEPLDTLATLRRHAPDAAVIVVTGAENVADGTGNCTGKSLRRSRFCFW